MWREKRHNRRSPCGENDQIGAINYVPPGMLVRLFQSVKHGKVYDLGQVIQMGALCVFGLGEMGKRGNGEEENKKERPPC